MNKLNVGCGKDYREGWINLDNNKSFKKDVSHNFNKLPYPFKDNTFDMIDLRFVFEHMRNPVRVLKELVRISKDNADIYILTSHGNSYAQTSDLQHNKQMNEHIFEDWQIEEYGLDNSLKLESFKWVWHDKNNWKKLIPFKRVLKIFLNGIYDNMEFVLKVKKNG